MMWKMSLIQERLKTRSEFHIFIRSFRGCFGDRICWFGKSNGNLYILFAKNTWRYFHIELKVSEKYELIQNSKSLKAISSLYYCCEYYWHGKRDIITLAGSRGGGGGALFDGGDARAIRTRFPKTSRTVRFFFYFLIFTRRNNCCNTWISNHPVCILYIGTRCKYAISPVLSFCRRRRACISIIWNTII